MGSSDLEAGLARLGAMAIRDLRAEWRRLHRAEPPRCLSRDLLVRGIAYRIQEQAAGGPSAALKRRLRGLAERLAGGRDLAGGNGRILRPGARLLREWHGVSHSVTVLEDGFDYDGRHYRSLSQIARAITGARWSGPRFFGLTKGSQKPEALSSEDRHDPGR